jgi:hypothetical protein
MSFATGTLINVSGHENNTLGRNWLFKGDGSDAVATIAASGFFNPATNVLQKGDIITIRAQNGTALCQVTSATAAATVTVGAFTALT